MSARGKCMAPVLRSLDALERLFLELLVEQFETIGRIEPARLAGALTAAVAGADIQQVTEALYEAGRLEDYLGMPMLVRDAAGARLYPMLVTTRPGRQGRGDGEDESRERRFNEAVVWLVGRKMFTAADLQAALGAATSEGRRVLAALIDRGLVQAPIENHQRTYFVREVRS